MSWQSALMYVVVAGIGFPAAFRNATAAVLCLAWLAGETIYIITGNSLPLSFFFMADVAVISIIYAKTIRRVGVKIYPTLRKQIYCMFLDLTPYDRWIVAIFLLGAWPIYVLDIHPYYKWHGLWLLAILQFVLAGAEALLIGLRSVSGGKPKAGSGGPSGFDRFIEVPVRAKVNALPAMLNAGNPAMAAILPSNTRLHPICWLGTALCF